MIFRLYLQHFYLNYTHIYWIWYSCVICKTFVTNWYILMFEQSINLSKAKKMHLYHLLIPKWCMKWDEWHERCVIDVDSYHTQKGVYTANQIPTRTERNAWHQCNVMKTKNETKLMVKPIKTLTLAPYKKSPVAYDFISATYQTLTFTHPHMIKIHWNSWI